MTTLAELVPTLLAKTREGKINWEGLADASFIARLGELVVEAQQARGGDTIVRLRRSDGAVIDITSYSSTPAPIDAQIVQLYELARRKGLAIDETLDDLKRTLNSL